MKYCWTVICLLLQSGFLYAQSSVPSYVPLTNLIAYYTLDGNVKNALDSTVHIGSATNATLVTDRFNQPQKAYFLNGTNAHLTLPASVMTQVSGAFSVSIWHFIDSTFIHRGVGYELIADRVESTWLYRFRIGYGYDNAPVHYPDSSYFDRIVGSNNVPRLAGPNPNIDSWTHYVYTYSPDSGGTISGYVDGVLVGRRINSGNVTGGRQINVGRALWPGSGSVGNAHVKGIVDDIGIWNRALTPMEVQQLYTNCEIQITTSPQSTASTIGGVANFNVSVATPGVTYQWQIDTTGNGVFQNLLPSTQFVGVDSSTLVVLNTGRNLHQARFRCLVFGSTCFIYSEIAQLNVICPILITQQPASLTGVEGDTAIFTTNLRANASYTWQMNLGSGFTNMNNSGLIAGANTHELRIFGLSFALDGARLRCVMSFDGCTDTSAEAQITTLCAPRILAQPSPVNIIAGNQVQFSVQAMAGTTFAWYRNQGFGFQPLQNSGQILGAQTAVLTLANVGLVDHQSMFKCIVAENNCVDTSAIVALNIIGGVSVENLNKQAFDLYPNPAQQQITIAFQEPAPAANIKILDAQGRLVRLLTTQAGEARLTIDLSDWAEGLYLLQTDLGTKRFLVQR
jgi:hypothetical protein